MTRVSPVGSPLCCICKKRPGTTTVTMTTTIEGEEKTATALVCRKCAMDIACGR